MPKRNYQGIQEIPDANPFEALITALRPFMARFAVASIVKQSTRVKLWIADNASHDELDTVITGSDGRAAHGAGGVVFVDCGGMSAGEAYNIVLRIFEGHRGETE